eukprot:362120-Chlamydomonas_euryale.AAC.5
MSWVDTGGTLLKVSVPSESERPGQRENGPMTAPHLSCIDLSEQQQRMCVCAHTCVHPSAIPLSNICATKQLSLRPLPPFRKRDVIRVTKAELAGFTEHLLLPSLYLIACFVQHRHTLHRSAPCNSDSDLLFPPFSGGSLWPQQHTAQVQVAFEGGLRIRTVGNCNRRATRRNKPAVMHSADETWSLRPPLLSPRSPLEDGADGLGPALESELRDFEP